MTARFLELGPIGLELRFSSALLAERFDWRFGPGREMRSVAIAPGASEPATVPGTERANALTNVLATEGWIEFSEIPVARSEGADAAPLPENAWQPELRSRREGSKLHVDWSAARGSFDLTSKTGRFEIAPVRGCGIAIDDVLRVVGFEIALAAGVLLFHSAAVGPTGEPWVDLFAGRSGVGKSTLTERLVSAGESAISDDLVFVDPGMSEVHRGEAGTVAPRALPTPYRGTSDAPRDRRLPARLKAIHLLVQSATPSCHRLSGAEAMGRVLRSVVTYRPLSLSEAEWISSAVQTLLVSCPVFELALDLASDPREVAAAAA